VVLSKSREIPTFDPPMQKDQLESTRHPIQAKITWNDRESNPGSPPCEGGALPLCHHPVFLTIDRMAQNIYSRLQQNFCGGKRSIMGKSDHAASRPCTRRRDSTSFDHNIVVANWNSYWVWYTKLKNHHINDFRGIVLTRRWACKHLKE
jgi:hypothetical protein